MVVAVISLVILAVAVLYAVQIYNNLVRLKHGIDKAWANIDVALKQRHEELPKLVEVCKQYMHYEQETLDRVVRARGAVFEASAEGDPKRLGAAEGALRAGLGSLFALAEGYPDLKANDSFRHLSTRISGLEETIADRRELYNESVNRNNVRIEQFPDLFVARLFAFGPRELLEFASERQDVDLRALFG
ncbi:LemA family protein [Thioalkalicoccus limnaeus]|uniref:LemA family protein n=1 Tax=Thioalkalicoccus limnaeus TaxID=120681 RepID=A0ABV4BFR4_9GAMM